MPTCTVYFAVLSFMLMTTVASGASSPVSAALLRSPKLSAFRFLNAPMALFAFSGSKSLIGCPFKLPAQASPDLVKL